jgi:hypothetical protein
MTGDGEHRGADRDDLLRCPLCAGPNECGRAQGQARCWCFEQRMPAALLEHAARSGESCLCRGCAEAGGSVSATTPPRPR